jgi:tetratricopeptide (TPR) repeat protein
MQKHTRMLALVAAALAVAATLARGQAPAPTDDPLKQGQDRVRAGDLAGALAIYERAATTPATAFQAHLQAGTVLDLLGRYEDARTHLTKAIALAASPDDKTRAARTMAMSYAFEGSCEGAEKYQGPLVEAALAAKQYENAGEFANELARVCLESGAIDRAETWYRKGHEAALQTPGLDPAAQDLWNFRWEHAQARIAARRGKSSEAETHVAAAKALLDKGTNPNQAPFLPYLVGYVAFYRGDYQAALTELSKGNERDPFIQALIAQAHDKLGKPAEAKTFYEKVLTSTAHNPTNAYARPIARKALGK